MLVYENVRYGSSSRIYKITIFQITIRERFRTMKQMKNVLWLQSDRC